MAAREITIALTLAALICAPAGAILADDEKPADFKQGALHGKVLDLTTGKPVPGATVAVTDKSGKVLAWSKTNEKGEYVIAVDTEKALRLNPSRRRGLLEQVVKTVGDVVTTPVKVAAGAVKNAGETAKGVALAAATGNPAGAAVAVLPGALTNPNQTKDDAKKQATEAAVKTVLGERQAVRKDSAKDAPGEVMLMVSCESFREAKGKAGAYWLESVQTADGKPAGPRGWLETVKLAPSAAPADKQSVIENEAFLLAEPKLEPSLVLPGGKVTVRARLQAPAGEKRPVRIFAREEKKRTVVELKPDDKGIYTAEFTLDPKLEPGQTSVTVCGLRDEPLEVKLDKKKPDPLAEFVRKLDDLDAGKPFEYDPRIMACENRLDFTVTVLDPKKGTPAVGK